MGVGGIKGGGKGGKVGGPKGAGSKGGVGKATGGTTFGKVDRSESLVGPSGLAGSSNVQGAEPVLTAQALAIAREYQMGHLKSKTEASRKFVAEIMRQKLRMQSKRLTDQIADALEEDPRLNQALDRLWSKG